MNKQIKLDIDLIPQDLYDLLLKEFRKQNNLSDNDTITDWEISAELEQERKLVTTYLDGVKVYEGDRFVNQCDITNEGMDEGWIVGNGDMYIKYESDAIDFCKTNFNMTLQEAYDNELIYWTEWDIVSCDEFSYEIKDGQLIEIEL